MSSIPTDNIVVADNTIEARLKRVEVTHEKMSELLAYCRNLKKLLKY